MTLRENLSYQTNSNSLLTMSSPRNFRNGSHQFTDHYRKSVIASFSGRFFVNRTKFKNIAWAMVLIVSGRGRNRKQSRDSSHFVSCHISPYKFNAVIQRSQVTKIQPQIVQLASYGKFKLFRLTYTLSCFTRRPALIAEQAQIFLERRNVFAWFPTCYGKSLAINHCPL